MSETDTVYTYLLTNTDWQKIDQLPVPNRAMNFGDGLFETMVFDGGKIKFGDFHLDRMFQGLYVLNLLVPRSAFDSLESFVLDNFAGQKLRIRWNIFRAGLGKYTPESQEAIQTVQIQRFIPAPLTKGLASFSEKISLYPSLWSRFKTLSALPYVMAAQERLDRGLDELILLDYSGKVAEASASNIFWRKGKKVFTPALTCGGIDGIGRRVIMSKISRLITEGIFGPNDLLKADQVWVSNVTGISYLEKIDSLEFSTEEWEPLSEIFE